MLLTSALISDHRGYILIRRSEPSQADVGAGVHGGQACEQDTGPCRAGDVLDAEQPPWGPDHTLHPYIPRVTLTALVHLSSVILGTGMSGALQPNTTNTVAAARVPGVRYLVCRDNHLETGDKFGARHSLGGQRGSQ